MHYLQQPGAEASEHLLHVAALLHGDDTEMILLIHPHQESLSIVVPERDRQRETGRERQRQRERERDRKRERAPERKGLL